MRIPTLALIVPVFKHPGLLAEALDCALAQRGDFAHAIVIVDDGCPFEETRTIAASYALAHPEITYLRKANGGLSSARNFGIDFALRAWPELEAIYFLDADNRLTPTAMANALGLIRSSGADWIYPSIDKFGIEWSASHQAPYSRLAHITFDNICEAGSLVHRRVFDAGIRFDESMRQGFEDWEFWLQALAKGFRGRCHPSFGLEYRQRAESMLRDSNRLRASILTYMRTKHRALFSLRNLLAFEHEEAPRFALFDSAAGDLRWFSDTERAPRRLSLEDYLDAYAAEALEPEIQGTPPYAIWLPPAAEQALREAGLFANLLWHAQRQCGRFDAVAIHLVADARAIALDLDGTPDNAPIGWAAGQDALREAARGAGPIAEGARLGHITLRLPAPDGAFDRPADAPHPDATLARLRQEEAPSRRRWIWRAASAMPPIRRYGDHLAEAIGADHVMPRARLGSQRHIGFAVPGGLRAGVGRIAAAFAATLRAQGHATHLFVIEDRAIALDPDWQGSFDSISFLAAPLPATAPHGFMGETLALAGDLEGADKPMLGLLTELDVLVCSHTPALSPVLGELRKQGTKLVAHLHALERTKLGRGTGHPYLALAFEHVYDLMLAATPELRDWLQAEGVPPTKLCVYAPGLDPAPHPPPRAPGLLRAALVAGAASTEAERQVLARMVLATRQAGLPLAWQAQGEGLALLGPLAALGVTLGGPVPDLLVQPLLGEASVLAVQQGWQAGAVPVLLPDHPAASLLNPGEDGLLLADAAALPALLRELLADPARRTRLSAGAVARAATLPDPATALAAFVAQLARWFET
jgi:glycosyltransferase involved in cell wall biosynthesis